MPLTSNSVVGIIFIPTKPSLSTINFLSVDKFEVSIILCKLLFCNICNDGPSDCSFNICKFSDSYFVVFICVVSPIIFKLLAVNVPSILAFPITCNLSDGFIVPIPTLPSFCITNLRSVVEFVVFVAIPNEPSPISDTLFP